MADTNVLLVEDDDAIAAPLERALGREGYQVRRVANGGDALAQLRARPYDLMILDLGLPDIDGIEVCRQVRESGYAIPVMMLTARSDELDRVVGLDVGADDYLAKPFGLAELGARLRALLRRSAQAPDGATAADDATPTGEVGGAALRLDEGARRVWVDDDELSLTPKEFDLLALLHRESGRVVTRERLMDEVWDENWYGSTKTLDVTLGRLRGKLEASGATTVVVTVRGVGFRLEPGPSRA